MTEAGLLLVACCWPVHCSSVLLPSSHRGDLSSATPFCRGASQPWTGSSQFNSASMHREMLRPHLVCAFPQPLDRLFPSGTCFLLLKSGIRFHHRNTGCPCYSWVSLLLCCEICVSALSRACTRGCNCFCIYSPASLLSWTRAHANANPVPSASLWFPLCNFSLQWWETWILPSISRFLLGASLGYMCISDLITHTSTGEKSVFLLTGFTNSILGRFFVFSIIISSQNILFQRYLG